MKYVKRWLSWILPLCALFVLGVAMIYFIYPAADIWLVWRVYRGYIDTVSNLTGLNSYLVTAIALLLFVPFYKAVTLVLSHPFNSHKRWLGIGILLVIATAYNLSLYAVTRETTFGFTSGAPHRYYAITPSGVHFYDRPGVDTEYGIPLKPVTPENVHDLELLKRGRFERADPTTMRFFNPATGGAELWYYKTPEGSFEFYGVPGFHPGTGVKLEPVTSEIYLEWKRQWDAAEKARKAAEEKARREAEAKAEKAAKEQRVQGGAGTTNILMYRAPLYTYPSFGSHSGVLYQVPVARHCPPVPPGVASDRRECE